MAIGSGYHVLCPYVTFVLPECVWVVQWSLLAYFPTLTGWFGSRARQRLFALGVLQLSEDGRKKNKKARAAKAAQGQLGSKLYMFLCGAQVKEKQTGKPRQCLL